MADEDITLDGKPLQSLRVADLKAALEQRNLPKSGQKNTLIKRLKGALMLENLQRSSSTQSVLQPNSQIGEEMCQNSFIKQYLAKQQELLRQRLEREAQKEDDDDDESPAGPEEEDDEDNDSSSDKHQPSLAQSAVPDLRGGDSSFHHQEALETPRVRVQQATFQQGEPPAPSPPRAVASLSVRVVGQPDCQGFPLASPRPQEKEPAGLSQPGSAHPVLNLGRSAKSSAGNHVRDDSDEDDNDSDNEDEDWGPDPGRSGRQKRMPPSLPQLAPNMSSAASRSKRKLQPPQHILPPQVDPIPMQLRHPTPPPSPPPNLFPLPDTPKQSPPDDQERHGLREAQAASFHPPSMQRQDSDSSSRSSSPEPHVVRRPGPLSLLVHKMETEEASSARGLSEEKAHSTSGRSGESLPQHGSEKERKMKEEKEREQQQGLEKERRKTQEQEREKKRSGEKKEEKTRLEEERKRRQREEQEKERKRREQENDRKRKEEEKKREERRVKEEKEKKRKKASEDRMVAETQGSGSSSDSDSKSDSSSHSSSSSSSSSRDKTQTANQLKKADQKQDGEDEKKANLGKALEKQNLSKRTP